MTKYRKSWTQVIEEVILNEALKPLDKSVVDAFYYRKEKEGKVLSTDGDTLTKMGIGGQQIAKWVGRKVKITAVSDVKSTESILKYMKKSIPSGLLEEDEATRMPMEAPFVLVEKDEDEGYGGTDKWKKGQKKLKKAGIKLHKKDRASGYVEGVTGPTRMDVQKHFDKEKGLLRVRINATEKALKISDMKVDAKGTVQSFKEEVEINEKEAAYPATIDTLRKIVKDKQNQVVMFKSGQARVDLFTASAMVQVYDALKKPAMKKTFEKMITDKAGFMKTQAFAMKIMTG